MGAFWVILDFEQMGYGQELAKVHRFGLRIATLIDCMSLSVINHPKMLNLEELGFSCSYESNKSKLTNVISIVDSKETLMLEEESRSKMLLKQSDPIVLEKKVNIKPINYAELNRLSKDFGKRFVPQQELFDEQAFQLQTSHPNTDQSASSLVKIEAPWELPKKGNEGFENTKDVFLKEIIPFVKTLKDIFNVFDKDLLNEVTEVQTVFNQMEVVVQQIMSSITAQQAKLDLELVPKEKRLEIRKCNGRLNPGKTQREPNVYMHQFWDSIHKHDNFYRFRMDKKKKFYLNLEAFKDVFQICPRVHGQDFDELPTDEVIMSFFKELSHTGEIKSITNVVVDQMPQRMENFCYIINRINLEKTTGLNKLVILEQKSFGECTIRRM
ncbi:hypothetical protein Tco_1058579 [Tanacetum coccineum]|uniref:Reverse transcriptase domain-containing protein n=1 Tax=Tanacetum coccineum TaxID=301880 RepID=A0ABQ5HAE6_9ASTR